MYVKWRGLSENLKKLLPLLTTNGTSSLQELLAELTIVVINIVGVMLSSNGDDDVLSWYS